MAPAPIASPRVPFLDLAGVNARFDLVGVIERVVRSGRYLYGEEIAAFEREFAAYTGAAHCVALANGLDALRLTLRAWISLGRLREGDQVLVPANSFIASALAVTESGLSVRFVDVSPETFNVTPEIVADAIGPKTRAVMAVHLYGRLADIEGIRLVCRDRNLILLEDAAQAHGARSGATMAGHFGDAGAFSFYPTKNLGALGDAGCVVTDDAELARRVRVLGNYGSETKYRHEYLGVNSRMDEIQAATLRLKLGWLDSDNERRRQVAARYLTGIRCHGIRLPAPPADPLSHVWHLFVVACAKRNDLAAHLTSCDIDTLVHYPCAIHRQGAYATSNSQGGLLAAEQLQHEVLSLPIGPTMSDAQVEQVIAATNRWR